MTNTTITAEHHPLDSLLRTERLPHIWCPGCGLGIVTGTFLRALAKSGLDINKTTVVSGIGCTGRIAGYLKLDSFHVTHGRALPFATGLKMARPDLKVVVISGDGDLASIGGNHLIHTARRNVDMTVICVNNFTYGMTGGQAGPTTPEHARTKTSREGNIEHGFNLPSLVAAAGATYVARWTQSQVVRQESSIVEALNKRGFSFVEVIAPCPTYFGRMNKISPALALARHYRRSSIINNNATWAELNIELHGTIVTGKFLDIERPFMPAKTEANRG